MTRITIAHDAADHPDAPPPQPKERVLREWRTEPKKKRPKPQQMDAPRPRTHKP